MSAVVQYTKYFFGGGMYEFSDDGTDVTYRKYYNIGGMMAAMKEWVNQGSKTTYYFANDHLSSTSIVMSSSGNLLSENRYMPFGEVRTISGTTKISETDFGYTGQRDYGGEAVAGFIPGGVDGAVNRIPGRRKRLGKRRDFLGAVVDEVAKQDGRFRNQSLH